MVVAQYLSTVQIQDVRRTYEWLFTTNFTRHDLAPATKTLIPAAGRLTEFSRSFRLLQQHLLQCLTRKSRRCLSATYLNDYCSYCFYCLGQKTGRAGKIDLICHFISATRLIGSVVTEAINHRIGAGVWARAQLSGKVGSPEVCPRSMWSK